MADKDIPPRIKEIAQGAFEAGWAACCEHIASAMEACGSEPGPIESIRRLGGRPPPLQISCQGGDAPEGSEPIFRKEFGERAVDLTVVTPPGKNKPSA
jgi:hypothetical protein